MKISSGEESLLEKILEIRSVKKVSIAFGIWDAIAEIEARDEQDLGNIISAIRRMHIIKDTLTLIVDR